GHLRHGFGRHERPYVDVAEPGVEKRLHVLALVARGDGALDALPGVARALDPGPFGGGRHATESSRFRTNRGHHALLYWYSCCARWNCRTSPSSISWRSTSARG